MNFDALTQSQGDTDSLFTELSHQLAAAGRWHELFEVRLIEARARLGLSTIDPPPLDDLPEPARATLEDDYTAACREVGGLLVEAGRFREAWQYLRAAGAKRTLHDALSRAVPDDENIEELVELALYEAVDAERGFGWLVGHYGTCNAITTLEGLAHALPPADLKACAAVLVRHVDQELRGNLSRNIEGQEGTRPVAGQSIGELIEGRDWLFEGEWIHIDASHLAATVRFARLATEPQVIRLALGLTEYGLRVHESLQYPGDPPFENLYEAHRHFFRAQLGTGVDDAITYFRQRAEASEPYHAGTAAIETLLVLLDRVGRPGAALEAYQQLVPTDTRLSGHAPRLVHLAQCSGDWSRYEAILRHRDDPVGFAMGLVARGGTHERPA